MEFFTPNERSLATKMHHAIAQLARFGFYRQRPESVSKSPTVLWRTLSACRVETLLDTRRDGCYVRGASRTPVALRAPSVQSPARTKSVTCVPGIKCYPCPGLLIRVRPAILPASLVYKAAPGRLIYCKR